MKIVTTYDPKTWNVFAKKNIDTFSKVEAETIVYHELATEGQRSLFDTDLQSFLDLIQGFYPARGLFKKNGKAFYNYNYDAWKFCRKVYAIAEAAKEDTDYLIWLDADVEILKPIYHKFIKDLMKDNHLALFQRPNYHSECGVIIFSMPYSRPLIEAWVNLYKSGFVFQIPMGWHDCWTLDACVENLKPKVLNLSPQLTQDIDVINNSFLSGYLRHDKGNRKWQAQS